jgi:hypothetical protein
MDEIRERPMPEDVPVTVHFVSLLSTSHEMEGWPTKPDCIVWKTDRRKV